MLEKLHLTPRQWKIVLKWALHTALFLFVMMVQTVCLGDVKFFGVSVSLLPILLSCVCIKEEPGAGGVFTLIASLIWCWSGADFGSMAVFLLPVTGVLSGIACRAFINNRFLPCALCCLLNLWLYESIQFLLKFMFGSVAGALYLTKVLPCVALSMLACPLLYLAVKAISRIGGSNGI
jgi:cell shape-determining protein MreD